MDFTNFFHTEILTGLFFSTNTGLPTPWLEVCVVLCCQIFLNFQLLAQGTPKQNVLGKIFKKLESECEWDLVHRSNTVKDSFLLIFAELLRMYLFHYWIRSIEINGNIGMQWVALSAFN